MWAQPLAPVSSVAVSGLIAAIPLVVVLLLMGVFRRSGFLASACGILTAAALAIGVWHMPVTLAAWSIAYGFAYALLPVLWIVFAALWLYNLAVDTGSFEALRRWMLAHASGDACIQAILIAFCFGALLEGSAGFGAPVAVTAFLLVGLGFEAHKAVVVALVANTAPVAFGAVGLPIVALAGVTDLDVMRLSAMVGRQLPLLSLILPAYLVLLVGGTQGLRRAWPAALVTGVSFALVQLLVSNFWGPYATDIVSALFSILVLTVFVRARGIGAHDGAGARASRDAASAPSAARGEPHHSAVAAWLPWAALSAAMALWSYFHLFQRGQIPIAVPRLDKGVLITLYDKPYAAVFNLQPLAGGTAVLTALLLTALCFRVPPRRLFAAGGRTVLQLRVPGLTVLLIVALAYLYNYSGMVYTLGAAVAHTGSLFPILSSYLGWLACFLTGSDTAANVLFGNLQVAAAHQLDLNPVLLAATNSSGAVAGKMISPQNIAIGVSTVGLIGREGAIMQSTFWHSVLFAGVIGLIAFAQGYYFPSIVP